VLCQKQHNSWKLLTSWPINFQISGGRAFAALVTAPPEFDADGFTLTSGALQIPLEISSLSGCPDGRPHFAAGLSRGLSLPIGSSLSAIAEAEAGVGKFSFDVSIVVAVRFRFRILAGWGRGCGADLKESQGKRM
jgi:hypothetical protein